MVSKAVNTTISQELRQAALIAGLSWSECLELGIKIKLGIDLEIDKIEAEERLLRARLSIIKEEKQTKNKEAEVIEKVKEEYKQKETKKEEYKEKGRGPNGEVIDQTKQEILARRRFRSMHSDQFY